MSNLFVKTRRWFSSLWDYGTRPGRQAPAQGANPAAAEAPVNNIVNDNPVGNNVLQQMDAGNAGGNPVDLIEANEAANADLIAQVVSQNPEEVLEKDLIAEAPKRKNLKKKKKKK